MRFSTGTRLGPYAGNCLVTIMVTVVGTLVPSGSASEVILARISLRLTSSTNNHVAVRSNVPDRSLMLTATVAVQSEPAVMVPWVVFSLTLPPTLAVWMYKHVYYHCSFGRGPCDLPYMPQPKLSAALGVLLQNIQIPEEIASKIADSIEVDRGTMETSRERETSTLNQRLSHARTLMDKLCEEKLLGNVPDGVYERKMHQYREEEMRLQAALESASAPSTPDYVLSARRILELAQKAHSLYLSANDAERGNCSKLYFRTAPQMA